MANLFWRRKNNYNFGEYITSLPFSAELLLTSLQNSGIPDPTGAGWPFSICPKNKNTIYRSIQRKCRNQEKKAMRNIGVRPYFVGMAVVSVLSVFLTIGSAPAFAAWPERPITVVVPWGVGGGTDVTTRIVASMMEKKLGQPMNVVNRIGGNTLVAHSSVANAAPDGYTLGALVSELSMLQWTGQSKLSYKDFALIGAFNLDAASVHVKKDSPFKDFKDLAEAIRKDVSKLRASGTGIGGINHLAYVGLVEALGSPTKDAAFVPANGAGPSMQLLASGAIDLAIVQMAEARPLMEAGEVRPLAILGKKRDKHYPNVPTVMEAAGVNFTVGGWRGLGAPKALPNDIRDKLEATLKEVVESPAFVEAMEKQGFTPIWMGHKEFEAFHAEQDIAFGKMIKAAGLAK